MDIGWCKKEMGRRIYKHKPKGLANLFHGKITKTGNDVTYSEKKNRRLFKVNSFRKKHWSDVLNCNFTVHTSTKAWKTIRKYGGFDNYILLSKPGNMQSLFGEYLRQIMYRTMMDPNFKVHSLYHHGVKKEKINPDDHYFDKFWEKKKGLKDGYWHPPDVRHKDLTKYLQRTDDMLPKRDLEAIQKVKALKEAGENITIDHPAAAPWREQFEEQERMLKEQDAKVTELHGIYDPFKSNKVHKAIVDAQIKDAEKAMEQQSRMKIDIK